MAPPHETSTTRRRRRGTTILHANDHRPGVIACFFRAQGKGAREWQSIVDTFEELLEWIEKPLGLRILGRDESRSFGQGAIVFLDHEAYGVLRVRFEAEPAVRRAEDRGEFVFDEGVDARRAVDDVRTRLKRAREERSRHA